MNSVLSLSCYVYLRMSFRNTSLDPLPCYEQYDTYTRKLLKRYEYLSLHCVFDSVDELTIPSTRGKGVLRRVTEVFDCWFESGSMPYAQQHYPFERKKEFEDR